MRTAALLESKAVALESLLLPPVVSASALEPGPEVKPAPGTEPALPVALTHEYAAQLPMSRSSTR